MKNDIISLNEVYKNDELFYWTNCLGEVNMPGDGKNTTRIHSPEELPNVAKKVFDLIELNHGLTCHVVSFRGKIVFRIDAVLQNVQPL